MSTGSKHWTHPLSDSFEYDDGLTSPDSIKLDTDSHPSPISTTGKTLSQNSYNYDSYQNGDPLTRSHSSCVNGVPGGVETESGNDWTQRYVVKDHSEKTANEFLSRIDIAIATTRERTLPLKQNSQQWVTFESDSESEQHPHRPSGRTSRLANGPQLRHSLRKLEKKQDELYQL